MSMANAAKQWTLQELHSLPDDGNKYELVRGELFVTPPPPYIHETIAAKLTHMLVPYVTAHGLGFVYRPRAVMRFEGSEVEPDLMVRLADPGTDWDRAPVPTLIVEIFSGSTRPRDQTQKRQLYMEAGVAEYWMVDPDRQVLTVVRPGRPDLVSGNTVTWSPQGARSPFALEIRQLFS